jgi:glutamyl-tRNA synthetase
LRLSRAKASSSIRNPQLFRKRDGLQESLVYESMSNPNRITRLAPSPTGALHLGNVRTFVVNYLLARHNGSRVLMRVEDLDGPRVKVGADAQMLQELAWLGLQWEEPIVYQSQRGAAYRAALAELTRRGVAYPCVCSRKDVESASSAPHASDGIPYAGTCVGRFTSAQHATKATGRPAAWRVRITGEPIEVDDQFAGRHSFDLASACGDFVIFKGDGLAAYQLAVVVDDAAGGVDCIVRGEDLLESAARQIYLRRLLDLSPQPRYWHLPLVIGLDGKRLAKRHGDTRIAHYRDAGATPQRILGMIAFWSGLTNRRQEMDMPQLLQNFDVAKIPRHPVIFSAEDDKYLRGA